MKIRSNFPGGNVIILRIEGTTVYFVPDLRNTTEDWFYWCLCVEDAAGMTLTFVCEGKRWIGPWGPAVKKEGDWYFDTQIPSDSVSFTYTFGTQENRVWFCHDLPYMPERFVRLAEELALPLQPFAVTPLQNTVDCLQMGRGDRWILLTSRHHACESTGTYVMEGMLREFSEHLPDDYRIMAVPFMDLDGVLLGEQGKGRIPHDHNRDYSEEPLYSSVAAIQRFAAAHEVTVAFDLHSPWHSGGRNDLCFIPRCRKDRFAEESRFAQFLQQETEQNPRSLRYFSENDLPAGADWNNSELKRCASCFLSDCKDNRLSLTLETPYFGLAENRVTIDRLLEYGRCVARAVLRYLNGLF